MFNRSLKYIYENSQNQIHKQIYAYNQLLTIFAHLKLMAIYTQECVYLIVSGNFITNTKTDNYVENQAK